LHTSRGVTYPGVVGGFVPGDSLLLHVARALRPAN
jgi:hypothetical protein